MKRRSREKMSERMAMESSRRIGWRASLEENRSERSGVIIKHSQGAKEAVEMVLRQEEPASSFNTKDIPCLGYTIYSDPHVQVRQQGKARSIKRHFKGKDQQVQKGASEEVSPLCGCDKSTC